jgi:hypothetical protein
MVEQPKIFDTLGLNGRAQEESDRGECAAHVNPPAPRVPGADPNSLAFGRSALSVLLGLVMASWQRTI